MYFTKKYCIALDSKARLVLPLEIRDALGVKKNEKILLSFSTAQSDQILIGVAKASDENGIKYSKNCEGISSG